jgi:hypothetical protein
MIEFLRHAWAWVGWALDWTARFFEAFIAFLFGAFIVAALVIGGFNLMIERVPDGADVDWLARIFGAGMLAIGFWICVASVRSGVLWLWRQYVRSAGRTIS